MGSNFPTIFLKFIRFTKKLIKFLKQNVKFSFLKISSTGKIIDIRGIFSCFFIRKSPSNPNQIKVNVNEPALYEYFLPCLI